MKQHNVHVMLKNVHTEGFFHVNDLKVFEVRASRNVDAFAALERTGFKVSSSNDLQMFIINTNLF